MSLDDFLKTYYKQTHFNAMPTDVRARFDGFVKRGVLTDTMRQWRDKYMHLDGDKYVENEIPDVTKEKDLPDDVARELFVACQNAFVGMNGAIASFEDKDPLSAALVRECFGENNLFNVSAAKPECENGIKEIIDLLKSNPSIQQWVLLQKGDDGKKIFDDSGALNNFITKCDKGDYNTNGKVQAKVKKIAELFFNVAASSYSGLPTKLAPIGELQYLENVVAEDAFAMDPSSVNDKKLEDFRKNIAKKTGILQTLYRNKNFRDKFAEHDNGVITGKINKAEDEIDYQKKDSANYVAPKIEDSLTPLQQLEKWGTDTYNDVFKKYEELRGAPLFFFTESEDIFKAIDKEKIKPADGLNSVLDKASAIQSRLANSNPRAKEYFDWFIETINAVKNDIPTAIAGAWKDGKQMQCVIEQIILRAAAPNNGDPNAIQKAMTAMEIMNAMKYGVLTSRIMDAMRNTDFNIFSDKDLSWNKNEGIKFITAAFDKSVKFAFLGIGYTATIIRNKIMLSKARTNFKNKNNKKGALGNLVDEQEAILESENKVQKKDLRNEINNIKQDKKGIKQDLANLAAEGITRNTIRSKETEVKGYKTSLDSQQPKEDDFQKQMGILREEMDLKKNIQNLQKQSDDLKIKVAEAEAKYRDPANYLDMPTQVKGELEKKLYEEWQKLKNDLTETNQQISDANTVLTTSRRAEFDAAKAYIHTNSGDHVLYRKTEKDYNDLKEKTEKFRNSTAELKDINKVYKERNAAMKNWDKEHFNKVLYLEKFWNILQNGDNKTYGISAKRAQEEFTAKKKDNILNELMNTYRDL